MKMMRWLGLAALVLACGPLGIARAGWGVGVYVGGPYGYRPYYRPYWGGVGVGVSVYPAYPVYVAPPPVVVSPGPVYAVPPPPVVRAPAPEPPTRQDQIDTYIDQLYSPQEETRVDALLQLGRLNARRASGRMARVLRDDPSPRVREAAARGLGLIGAPHTLAALQRAAQADPDPGVRGSARYAADVIRTSLRRNP